MRRNCSQISENAPDFFFANLKKKWVARHVNFVQPHRVRKCEQKLCLTFHHGYVQF